MGNTQTNIKAEGECEEKRGHRRCEQPRVEKVAEERQRWRQLEIAKTTFVMWPPPRKWLTKDKDGDKLRQQR